MKFTEIYHKFTTYKCIIWVEPLTRIKQKEEKKHWTKDENVRKVLYYI